MALHTCDLVPVYVYFTDILNSLLFKVSRDIITYILTSGKEDLGRFFFLFCFSLQLDWHVRIDCNSDEYHSQDMKQICKYWGYLELRRNSFYYLQPDKCPYFYHSYFSCSSGVIWSGQSSGNFWSPLLNRLYSGLRISWRTWWEKYSVVD